MLRPSLALAVLATTAVAFAADGVTLTDAQIDAAMAKADPDQDGTVNWAEARRFGLTRKAFDFANRDKDGTLDKKELAAAIIQQFKTANPDNDGTLDAKEAQKAGVKSKKVFEAANPDGDGTLDVAEFVVALVAQAK